MFKDDFRKSTELITASTELKRKTLEKINAKKEPVLNRYVRYGLVCASFLFIVSMFPVFYGNDGLSVDKNSPMPNATMPQTGVDNSITHNIDDSLSKYYKSPEEIQKELEQKQSELDALIKEKNEQAPAAESDVVKEPEHIDNKIQAYEKEIKEIEQKLDSEIKMQAQALSQNTIILNEIEQPVASTKIANFAADESLKSEDWTQTQIVEYLAVSPIPSYVPEDLTWGVPQADQAFTQKVYRKKDDNSFAYDTFSYSFMAPQLTRELNPLRRVLKIDVAKQKLPVADCLYMTESAEISTVIGVEMKLGISKVPYEFDEEKKPTSYYELYVAEFIHNDVGYRLVSSNLTQKEFTDVVTSVIAPPKKAS